MHTRFTVCLMLVTLLGIFFAQPVSAQAEPVRASRDKVTPHWLSDTRFWYRNDLPGEQREFVLVDAAVPERKPAFDHAKLAAALAAETGQSFDATKLPIEDIALEGDLLKLSTADAAWLLDLATYNLEATDKPPAPSTQPAEQRERRRSRRDNPESVNNAAEAPDGQGTLIAKDGNLFVQSSDGTETQLSTDGTAEQPYAKYFWSPDASHVVAYRLTRGDHKDVYRLESSPKDGGRAVLHTDEYVLPGDTLDSYQLSIFDVASKQQRTPEVEPIDVAIWGGHPEPEIRWRPDGKHFLYEKHDRGHQRLRVIEVDAATGDARTLLDEQSKTFIWTAHTEDLNLQLLNYLKNGQELIYVSEQSGWRQLYLLNLDSAELKPITQGEWVLRGIQRIDEDKRQIWFSASGVYGDQDPYLVHFGRVNFDGSGLTWLTQSNGTHNLSFNPRDNAFSPEGSYFVVSHSRVDAPPVTELHRTDTGEKLLTLEQAEVSDNWLEPEVFTAKARDGSTDIWGVIYRPRDFDPAKKYPVIECVYAGPQGAYVPKSFSTRTRFESITSLGFIVVQADGMGTAFRSKAFHDVCWQNLADAGFPDRIAWIKAAGAKYPEMDIERVGIFGTSAGGQSAAGALIFHNDFYKAAVANCGCHDNRMDKISWNEQWMGWPVGPQYSASSNIDNAEKLKGHLQLVLGEMDNNVPVESTYRLVNALVKANIDFEFVLIPGAGHGAGSPFTDRKLRDFFVRHLQTEPDGAQVTKEE